MDFKHDHLELISQYESCATEVEIALFTKRYHMNSKHYALLSVQSISILYSYWEGFVQTSFQMYVDYINESNMCFNNLSDEIKVFHMESEFKQFREYPERITKKIYFYEKLSDHFREERKKIYRVVNTESNVGFKVLNRLLCQFSLEQFPERWEIYNYPNDTLEHTLDSFLKLRNSVAHGGDFMSSEKVSQEVYSKYRILIKDLMYGIHDKFLYGIRNKTYLHR